MVRPPSSKSCAMCSRRSKAALPEEWVKAPDGIVYLKPQQPVSKGWTTLRLARHDAAMEYREPFQPILENAQSVAWLDPREGS